MFELLPDTEGARWPFPIADEKKSVDAFVAIRTETAEDDAIVFRTEGEMLAFCEARGEYRPLKTGLHTLKSALDLFR